MKFKRKGVRGQILYWFIAWVPVIGGMGWIVDEWCRQKYCCELDGEKREELEFILIRSILIITVFVFSLFNFCHNVGFSSWTWHKIEKDN